MNPLAAKATFTGFATVAPSAGDVNATEAAPAVVATVGVLSDELPHAAATNRSGIAAPHRAPCLLASSFSHRMPSPHAARPRGPSAPPVRTPSSRSWLPGNTSVSDVW